MSRITEDFLQTLFVCLREIFRIYFSKAFCPAIRRNMLILDGFRVNVRPLRSHSRKRYFFVCPLSAAPVFLIGGSVRRHGAGPCQIDRSYTGNRSGRFCGEPRRPASRRMRPDLPVIDASNQGRPFSFSFFKLGV